MTLQLHTVDAFSDRVFAGNPAAVCILGTPLPPGLMQQVASELNLSETAFVRPESTGFGLRWFTPRSEVDLCGHATLASAHVLWEVGILDDDVAARFKTLSGPLTCWKRDGMIRMDFPAEPADQVEAPEQLVSALGVRPVFTGRNRLDYLVELESEQDVRRLDPDLVLLAALDGRGVIVTANAGEAVTYDFVSRYFAPSVGVPEDPVTGSAHCCLGPFWHRRTGLDELTGYQASRRGGTVHVTVRGERVILAGKAVTVMRSEMTLPAGSV